MQKVSDSTCRFGVKCNREDCRYEHPQGRAIDAPNMNYPPMMMPSYGYGMYPPMMPVMNMNMPPNMNMGMPMMPQMPPMPVMPQMPQMPMVPPMGSGPGPSPSSPNPAPAFVADGPASANNERICRFGRMCNRPDCWFNHPEGRTIDETASNFDEDDDDVREAVLRSHDIDEVLCPCCHGEPRNCSNPDCQANGRCGCMFGEEDEDEEDENAWQDEWFPNSRNCACCQGYIYRCKKEDADCKEQCYCTLTADLSNLSIEKKQESSA